jgi:signal transduction histidine kinase
MNPVSRASVTARPNAEDYHPRVPSPAPTLKSARLLALGLALAFVLGAGATWILSRAAVRQRRLMEEAVRSQLGLMADAVANSIQAELWLGVRTLLRSEMAAAQKGDLPPPAQLTAQAREEAVGPGLIELTPDRYFLITPNLMEWSVSGPRLDSAGRALRVRALEARLGAARSVPGDRFAYTVSGRGDSALFLVVAPRRDGKGLIGFELPVAQLSQALFNDVLASHRRSVPAGARVDSLPLAVRVTSPAGFVLYQTTPPPEGPFLAAARMSGSLAARVEVSLTPRDIALLVQGGLPGRPGLWLVLGFLGYAVLLASIGVAAWRALTLARLRTDFAGTVSHELRTPLTQILLYAETLSRDQPLTADQRRGALEAIVRETRRLVQMVENVLTVSLAGRPTPRLVYQPEEIETLVHEVLAGFAPAFRQKRVHPVVSLAGPSTARCDGNAVRQILRNLVDNALRYGPEQAALGICANHTGSRLELVVEDSGPGVPEQERERIWEPFVRLNGTAERGTGIGLAVVRQLAELHGGSARVESAQRGGARFVVDLALPPDGSHG